MIGLTARMLDEAENFLLELAPQFLILGVDVGDIIQPLRAGAVASVGVAA